MVTFEVNNSGNLVITLTDKTYLGGLTEGANDEEQFIELIESQLCNGYHLVRPEHIGALTSSLLISDQHIDAETTVEECENANVWYYNYYAVTSYLADLKKQGYVIWNRAV